MFQKWNVTEAGQYQILRGSWAAVTGVEGQGPVFYPLRCLWLLQTPGICVFRTLKGSVVSSPSLPRGRCPASDLNLAPSLLEAQLARSLDRSPALVPQPVAALCCLQPMAVNPPGPAGPWDLMLGSFQVVLRPTCAFSSVNRLKPDKSFWNIISHENQFNCSG